MDNPNTTSTITPLHKKWWVWVITLLILSVSILVIAPYVYMYRNMMFPQDYMKDGYRDFPHIAVITITDFQNSDKFAINKLISAKTKWVHSQKSDWDKYGRRSYTLDFSESDKITVIFGYENNFDINAFANEIASAAALQFLDLNNNPVFYSTDILSARCFWLGEIQADIVALEMTGSEIQRFLTIAETTETTSMQIVFSGSIPSDIFTAEASDNNTIIIKELVNSGAADALVTLIELHDIQSNTKV